MSGEVKTPAALGFLTVIEHPQHGLFGGYLLLNLAGRPLEFHCTTPVKANRAQEILYGPTLLPYLYGEQIGHTLVSKATVTPTLICTDRLPALALREHVAMPVLLVLPKEEPPAVVPVSPSTGLRVDAAQPLTGPALWSFRSGRNQLALAAAQQFEQEVVERLLERAAEMDLAEPFGRIREAIEEAQRGR